MHKHSRGGHVAQLTPFLLTPAPGLMFVCFCGCATTLFLKDAFIRDHISSEDTLIVSVGGNDIALSPLLCTVLNISMLICCTPQCCLVLLVLFSRINFVVSLIGADFANETTSHVSLVQEHCSCALAPNMHGTCSQFSHCSYMFILEPLFFQWRGVASVVDCLGA